MAAALAQGSLRQLVAPRWCDNLDGTVTDLLGGPDGKGQCLVWLKDADCIGEKEWVDSSTWNDAQTESGILYDGSTHFSGGDCSLSDGSVEGDWRLPTLSELKALTSGTEPVLYNTPRAFTGIPPAEYWTSTTDASYTHQAYGVFLLTGLVWPGTKDVTSWHVWPVRGGQ